MKPYNMSEHLAASSGRWVKHFAREIAAAVDLPTSQRTRGSYEEKEGVRIWPSDTDLSPFQKINLGRGQIQIHNKPPLKPFHKHL